VRLWNEDGNAEQEIKRSGSRARLCPVCNPKTIHVFRAYRSALVYLGTVEEVRDALKGLPLSARNFKSRQIGPGGISHV
jgi:hypothetical protein